MSKRERHAMPPEARRAVEMLRSWVVVVRADMAMLAVDCIAISYNAVLENSTTRIW